MIKVVWYFFALMFAINVFITFFLTSEISKLLKGTSFAKSFGVDDPYVHFNIYSQIKFITAMFNKENYVWNKELSRKIRELKFVLLISLILFIAMIFLSLTAQQA